MLLVLDLGISSLLILTISLILPLFAYFIRRKWRLAALRREEIRRLLIHAKEESARAEIEATYEFSSPVPVFTNTFYCPVCFVPSTTRCSRCKSVRYCSGKCQIIHWRQGHKEECRPATIIYSTDDEGIDLVETSLVHREAAVVVSSPDRSLEDGGNNKDEVIIDKEEEAVSVAETSGSSFSGFSSSPRNDSSDEISVCESFSSSDSDRLDPSLDVETKEEAYFSTIDDVDDAPSKPVSPKFVHLVESVAKLPKLSRNKPEGGGSGQNHSQSSKVDSLVTDRPVDSSHLKSSKPLSPKFVHLVESVTNLPKLSRNKPEGGALQNQSQSSRLHSLVTDRPAADPSLLKSSDFWGTVLGSPEDVSVTCDSSKSVHFSLGSSRDTSVAKRSLKEGNAKRSDEAELSLPTSSSSDVQSPLDNTVLSHVAFQKSKSTSSESGCVLAPLKLEEIKILASKASNTKESGDVVKPSGRVVNHQKQNSVHPMNSLHERSGLKASALKVVDKFTRTKSSIENEMAGRHVYKGIFPYELFAKLYTNKIEFQPSGLINCGNSCFANVVFQCLMFTPPLTTYFLQQHHSRACRRKEKCFTCEFEKLVLKAKERKSPLSPDGLLSQLQDIGIVLGNGKQEDAHEFLRYVVDTMQSLSIKASEYDMKKTSKLEDTTLIGLTFGGYIRSKIKCMKCQGKSEQREKIMDLTVEIDGDISTLDDALLRFTKTEILDGENKYRCGKCKSYERAKKKLKIIEPPNVLTIALKRFQSGKFGKLNKLIRFPETLDLTPYVSGGSEKSSHEYKLYGVIVHLDVMNAAFSGHYVCYIRNSQNKWYKADDNTVVTSDVERVLTKGAYMLFYARCSPMPPRLVACTKTEASSRKSNIPVSIASPVRPGNIQSFYSSFQRLQRILEDDSSSDSSSLFDSNSDECSCSTDSTSTEDFADFIFGDHQGRVYGQSESSSSPRSLSSSPSPPFTRHSPLGDSTRSSIESYGTSRHNNLPLRGER